MDQKPIDMVLHCPQCGYQHIDAPEPNADWCDGCDPDNCQGCGAASTGKWTNPPHRSHLCANCKFVWRPCDVATNGVLAIQTKGEKDKPLPLRGSNLLKVGIMHPYRDKITGRKCYVRGFDVDDGATILVELYDEDDDDISDVVVTRERSHLLEFKESNQSGG